MVKSHSEGYSYYLLDEDIDNLPDFTGRSVDELHPQILIIKSGRRKQKYYQVFIQIADRFAKQVECYLICDRPAYDIYPFELTFEGIFEYVLKMVKADAYNWKPLIDEYDNFVKMYYNI